jgi:hypothetical protein
MLYRFLINYDERLYNGWIKGNLLVSEATCLWNISYETYNYCEYDDNTNISFTKYENFHNKKTD